MESAMYGVYALVFVSTTCAQIPYARTFHEAFYIYSIKARYRGLKQT